MTVDVPAAAAGSWLLGDLTVNRMGLGAMRLTGTEAFDRGSPRPREQSLAVLRRARELGVNHIDTAGFYFSPTRSANELINTALAPYDDDLVITTKVGPMRDASGEWLAWARPEQLRGQVEENLRQLGRDHLDVVNLRSLGADSIAEHFGVLAELREAGMVRNLGLSNVRASHLTECQAIAPVVCVQNRYGVDSRRAGSAELLRQCGEQGIAFVPFFTISGDAREGRPGGESDVVLEIANTRKASPAQVRLAWTLALGPHVLVIPGTGDPMHLEDNVAAASLGLTADELAAIDRVPETVIR